jgi:uncharacterized pyridoxal phosphate-containing UPF0001 family protein
MSANIEQYHQLLQELNPTGATLIAVSKTKPNEDVLGLYEAGQRDFGENYVQELVGKSESLPQDIRWHFIGHLQSNKIKYIAAFVHLIHGVDSLKLLEAINKEGRRIQMRPWPQLKKYSMRKDMSMCWYADSWAWHLFLMIPRK